MSKFVHAYIASAPAEWLRHSGGLPDGVSADAIARPEGVPIEQQRLMLCEVARRGGERALFALPSRLADATDQPLLFVMLNSGDIDDFIDKEQRFGRFFHSDHRVRILERGERMIVLQHDGSTSSPLREESLLVLAIHLQMFELIGCAGLTACLPESEAPAQVVFRDGSVTAQIPAGSSGCWRIEWSDFSPRRKPMAGLDELLFERAAPADLAAGVDTPSRVERVVCSDLAHRWTLSEVARFLHTSTRTLQRELAAAGTSFSKLLDAARVDAAADLLCDRDRSITEVGYVCGFSDSAHFSRRFKARKGTAPRAWRAANLS